MKVLSDAFLFYHPNDMTGSKILTVLLGFLLLLPLAWSFGIMLFRDYQTPRAEARRIFEEEERKMQGEFGKTSRGTMLWGMWIPDLDSIHPALARFWLFSPRRWVGAIGLACCVLVFSLWTWCAVCYVDIAPAVPDATGFMGDDDGPPPELAALPFYPTADARLNELIDLKLSDCPARRDGCAGEGGGAAGVTRGAVRSSAWLGDVGEVMGT